MATPQVNTYHCICTSLLLATTHTLSSLPRRAPPSLDHAIIVPLPPAPQQPTSTSRPSSSGTDSAGGAEAGAGGAQAGASKSKTKSHTGDESGARSSELGYTVLLSTTLDRRPTLIRRSDGFERRYLVRCGRCRLVVGYELDAEHYGTSIGSGAAGSSEAASAMDVDGDGDGKVKEKMKILYLLPGGTMSTEVMASGKKIGEKEVVLGEGERAAVVAAWE